MMAYLISRKQMPSFGNVLTIALSGDSFAQSSRNGRGIFHLDILDQTCYAFWHVVLLRPAPIAVAGFFFSGAEPWAGN
jgi:hypothetical protein